LNTELERDVRHFWELLFEIVRDMEKRLAIQLSDHQLTPPQFYVLKTLSEHEGRCRIGQIADEHHLTNATMTGLIKRLEARQPPLVLRERNDMDGRSVDVVLTDAGELRYQDVQDSFLSQARTLLHLLPADERQQAIARVEYYFRMLVELFPVEDAEVSNIRE